tara:strand:+ start:15416 stop:18799 length:3384 start_codon:yes stop_codon:yes gene_type:complete
MSEKKFKFVSPGVFLNEIDNSQLPKESAAVGPVIIGRSERGPALKPVRIESFSDFIETFGAPLAGGQGDDVYREGNGFLAPTYAGYAVQAYLRNSSPVNFVRLLGVQDTDALAGVGEAGWQSSNNGEHESAWGIFVGHKTDSTKGSATIQADARVYAKPASGKTLTFKRSDGTTHTFTFADGATSATNISRDGTGEAADPTTKAIFMANIKLALEAAVTAGATLGQGTDTIESVSALTNDSAGEALVLTLGSKFGVAGNVDIGGTLITDNTLKVNAAGLDPAAVQGTLKFVGGLGPAATSKLAAVLYTAPSGSTQQIEFMMEGRAPGDANSQPLKTHSNLMVAAGGTSASPKFNLVVSKSVGDNEKIPFSFDTTSKDYIRTVLNTNPVLTNDRVTDSTGGKEYWLGESFEHYITNQLLTSSGGTVFAFTAPLAPQNSAKTLGDWRMPVKGAQTGWFFSQNTSLDAGSYDPSLMQKLFKFCSINEGESNQRDFKISISDIKPPPKGGINPYGSFTVLVRRVRDTDNAVQIVERFSNCNLNPFSGDYIARKIGDVYQEWSVSENRYKHYGNYSNQSRYIRVEMNADVDNGMTSPEMLPFGVYGPPVWKTQVFTGSDFANSTKLTMSELKEDRHWGSTAKGWFGDADASALDNATIFLSGSQSVAEEGFSLSIGSPVTLLRKSGSDGGLVDNSKAYFGLQTVRSAGSGRYDEGYVDHVRRKPASYEAETYVDGETTQYSWVFSLDDIVESGSSVYYESGSYKDQKSDGAVKNVSSAFGWDVLLSDREINKFTSPMFGGFDGVNIRESEAFCNTKIAAAKGDARASYEFASVKRALDSVSDAEVVEANIMAMPGITDPTLTTMMIRNCEARADSLAVIDLPGIYTPPHDELKDTFVDRIGSGPQAVADAFSQRGINSSYGCTYYPWVKIYDEITDSHVWAPPSIVALGVFANTERRAALWFAPAGFNRGGLTEGSAGLPVLSVTEKLTSKDRDKLYEANINPIATFPSEGIVVFGQKTLQTTRSALDRINVRRLMIFVKKQVSRISNKILFDQNVQATWDRFLSQVTPFLDRVKQGAGLTDFKVVLDTSTTTPDLVDRNIMYAKIFLKPARSIEFIAIDFIITNTGAAFED